MFETSIIPMLVCAGLLLAGLVLAIVGWRGRRLDDHPLCKRCGYDLVASGSASNCPECGSNLCVGSRAVRIGHRRRRTILASLGVLILLAGLGGGSVLYWSKWRNFDWNTVKPLWLLRREAGGADITMAIVAQEEILSRLGAGQLAQSQVSSIISESLALQSDGSEWAAWRGDFIEDAWRLGQTTDSTMQQYLETAVDRATYLRVRPRIRQGQPVTIQVNREEMRLGRDRNRMLYLISEGNAVVADGQVLAPAESRSGIVMQGSGPTAAEDMTPIGVRLPLDLPLGSHSVGIDATFRVFARPGMLNRGYGFSSTQPSDWQFVISRRLEAPIEILDRDSPGVRLVDDETLAAHMRTAVRPRLARRAWRGQRERIVAWVDFHSPPMNVAFDVVVRDTASSRECILGSIAEKQGGGHTMAPSVELNDDTRWILNATTLEIVFRPSVDAAEATYDLSEIWGGTVVVPVSSIPVEPAAR